MLLLHFFLRGRMTMPTMYSLQILILFGIGRKWSDSLKDLLCNDGSHLETKGICADGSFPLVVRANSVPLTDGIRKRIVSSNYEH